MAIARDAAPLGVAVVGCGLIGRRRAATAAEHPGTRLRIVVDADLTRARSLADTHGCDATARWQEALARPDVRVVVVATPNDLLAEIGCAALLSGRDVLIEKPMGRGLDEAQRLAEAAARSGRLLKIGFNHRHHPAIAESERLFRAGEIGRLLSLRARYGHGSRPGCETEWRSDAHRAGGGELLDQGVHIADLFHWFAGPAEWAFASLQTAVWRIEPLEDNAFGLLGFRGGVLGQLHVSMTQWKNLFSLEVIGELGTLVVEGLGGSYGPERLVHVRRRIEGGVPEVTEREFPGPDGSWTREWDEFVAGMASGELAEGGVADGLAAMRIVDALYRSARSGAREPVA